MRPLPPRPPDESDGDEAPATEAAEVLLDECGAAIPLARRSTLPCAPPEALEGGAAAAVAEDAVPQPAELPGTEWTPAAPRELGEQVEALLWALGIPESRHAAVRRLPADAQRTLIASWRQQELGKQRCATPTTAAPD